MSTNDKQFATVFVAVLGALAVLAIILFFVAGYLTEDMASYKPEEVILENIKPVGQVNIASTSVETGGDMPEAAAAEAGTPVAAEPLSSEQIFQSKCFGCHGTGAAGAPKIGDADAWAPRIAKGMDSLLNSATNGLNAMPPKGLCMDCSEEDLRGVIEYMVNASQ